MMLENKQFNEPVFPATPKGNIMPVKERITAGSILQSGAKAIQARASVRDLDKERSMKKAVLAFNALFGKDLTETQGWQFMVCLKMSRSSQGEFHIDDYEDQASYSALAGECELNVS